MNNGRNYLNILQNQPRLAGFLQPVNLRPPVRNFQNYTVMSDVHSSAVRSYNMSRIRGKDTKPEMIVRKYLFSEGFRYRLHAKKLPGKPDIVLPRYKTVILIHGCFWHGHEGCKYYVIPKTRTDWWINKIQKNKIQDVFVENKLQDLGWKVVEIWECQLKVSMRVATLQNLKKALMCDVIA